MKKLRLWSCFWGDKHLELFEKALVRSLKWSLNRQALQGAVWDLWTKEEDFKIVKALADEIGIETDLNIAFNLDVGVFKLFFVFVCLKHPAARAHKLNIML